MPFSNFRKEGGTLRQMSTEKLLKTIPTLQNQLDALLDFEVTPADLNNGVINCAFMLLFRDLIRLFACYNDGIINLLGKNRKIPLKVGCSLFIPVVGLVSYDKSVTYIDRVPYFHQ